MYVCEKLKSKEGDNRSGYIMIRTLTTFILIIGLGISAYQDWKSREVKDWIWITLLLTGILRSVSGFNYNHPINNNCDFTWFHPLVSIPLGRRGSPSIYCSIISRRHIPDLVSVTKLI